MPRSTLTLLLALPALVAGGLPPAAAAAHVYRPDELVVRYAPATDATQQQRLEHAVGASREQVAGPDTRVLRLAGGRSVADAARSLRSHHGVRYAVPNYVARAADTGFFPNDPGRGRAGDWRLVQWNFLAAAGVDAPDAWARMLRLRAPGGRGVTVAVLDTGVAYRTAGRYRRSPDFSPATFVPGYDFVSHDRFPDDPYGHGTFVAGIVAERTNNRLDLTGIAYGARIMPVRVLDARGFGDAADIGAGIRFAAVHGARVINLSLDFDPSMSAAQIPEVLSAIAFARSRGAVVVGAAGNQGLASVNYPARTPGVISVGATTEHGCQADYSNYSPELDLVAPGGGADSPLGADPAHCHPGRRGRPLVQLSYAAGVGRFGFRSNYEGTSLSTPHVSAAAALVIASGLVGRRPSPTTVEARLKATARDLGPPGHDPRYGAGLVNAGAAVAPKPG
ncbi:MAG TPA: S8 family serine peptidase [Solirubrobacteraceae bacterium]|nr:S8 family serine peptidase [Solirubrobacteraceae bacterium]